MRGRDFGLGFPDPLLIRVAQVVLGLLGGDFGLQRGDLLFQVGDPRRDRGLADRDPGAGGIQQRDRLVRQLPGRDVAGREGDGGNDRLVRDADLVVRLHRPKDAAQHIAAAGGVGLIHHHRLETAGQGGVFFEILGVFRPGGRGDGPQGATRQRRLQQVRGVAGARSAPGSDQGMGLVDEQDDRDGRGLHLVDHRFQALFKLALHRGPGLHGLDVQLVQPGALQLGRHVPGGKALGKAFDHGCLADPGLAREDRVVLAAAQQDVDDLADLVIAALDRVHRPRRGRHVLGKPAQRAVARWGRARGIRRRKTRPIHRAHIVFFAVGPQRPSLSRQLVGRDRLEHRRGAHEGAAQVLVVQQRQQDMASADLHLAKEQGGIGPGMVQRITQVFGNAGAFGDVLVQIANRAVQILQRGPPVQVQRGQGDGDIRILVRKRVEKEMRQLHISVPLTPRVAHGLQEGVIARAV